MPNCLPREYENLPPTLCERSRLAAAASIDVIREDPADQDILYLGTELGVYCSIAKGQTWHSLCNTLPTCAGHDLTVHAGTGDLIPSTHGEVFFASCKRDSQNKTGDSCADR